VPHAVHDEVLRRCHHAAPVAATDNRPDRFKDDLSGVCGLVETGLLEQ
jgi:hypothetical protein